MGMGQGAVLQVFTLQNGPLMICSYGQRGGFEATYLIEQNKDFVHIGGVMIIHSFHNPTEKTSGALWYKTSEVFRSSSQIVGCVNSGIKELLLAGGSPPQPK